jgi:phage terminase small subunit
MREPRDPVNINLTPKERLFVASYTTSQNAEAAAVAAGFAPNKAIVTARRLMAQPKIKQALELALRPVLERYNVNRESIIQRVAEKFWEKEATAGEVARLGKLLAEMTPGALVPIDVHHSGELTLEAFLSAGQVPQGTEDQPPKLQLVGE